MNPLHLSNSGGVRSPDLQDLHPEVEVTCGAGALVQARHEPLQLAVRRQHAVQLRQPRRVENLVGRTGITISHSLTLHKILVLRTGIAIHCLPAF
jgi:hypothetical protein